VFVDAALCLVHVQDMIVAAVNSAGDPVYEIWLNAGPDGKLPNFLPPTQGLQLLLPRGAGSVSVADFNRDGSLDLVYAVSAGCLGVQFRGQGPEGLLAPPAPALLRERFDEQGYAPCDKSEIYVALNARSDSQRKTSEMCKASSEPSAVGVLGAAIGGHGSRVGERVLRTEDFGGASLFGGREPLPHHGNSREQAPLIATSLGV